DSGTAGLSAPWRRLCDDSHARDSSGSRDGGAIADPRGVLATMARQPFGHLLLGATALGLSGYVLWRLVQACLDPERKGTKARGLLTRLGFAVSGVAYAALAVLAARMALGMGGRSG